MTTRKEQIAKAAKSHIHGKCVTGGGNRMLCIFSFTDGATWADLNPPEDSYFYQRCQMQEQITQIALEALNKIMKHGTQSQGNTIECELAYEALEKINKLKEVK